MEDRDPLSFILLLRHFMKVLVIGSGGREHALVWKISQSPCVSKIYCAPGSAAIGELAQNVPIAADQIDRLADFAQKEKPFIFIKGFLVAKGGFEPPTFGL